MPGIPPIHPELEDMAFLLGRWEGLSRGLWDPATPIEFRDEMIFDHVGKPNLGYRQQTWRLDGVASHGEAGYLIAAGPGRVNWTVAEPSGIVEALTGSVDGQRLELEAAAIALAPGAKRVTAVERSLWVEGDVLRYELRIAMNDEPLADHISGELRRAE